MQNHLSVRQLVDSFDEVIERINGSGETLVIQRDGEAMCLILPAKPPTGTVADLMELLKKWPAADDGWAEGVEEAKRLGNGR